MAKLVSKSHRKKEPMPMGEVVRQISTITDLNTLHDLCVRSPARCQYADLMTSGGECSRQLKCRSWCAAILPIGIKIWRHNSDSHLFGFAHKVGSSDIPLLFKEG